MKKLLLIFIVVCFSSICLYAQSKTIKGRVIDEDLEIVPYASIVINDTVVVGRTALNGSFQIEIPVAVKEILLRDVGLENTAIVLSDTCDEAEIVMMFLGSYDFMTLKKVDRLRMKRFKKLPALHKEA